MSSEDYESEDQETTADASGEVTDESGDGEIDSAFVVGEAKKPVSAGTIVMIVLMSLGGLGVKFMYSRSGPQAASAATDPRAQQVIKQFMSEKERNMGLMQKMVRDTEAVVQQFLNYPSVTQVPLTALHTNPFRLTPAAPTDGSGKLDETAERKRREEERVAVLKAVQALQLQSVMVSGGQRGACMINNTLYTEGQQVEEFTIERIAPNSVIVRQGSYRFELRMQK